MNGAELFEMIADTARKYAAVMANAPVPSDQVMSWDENHQFVVVIARASAAEDLLAHLQPEESA